MTPAEHLPKPHWVLDRRINLGHLVATISMIAGLFIWGGDVQTRVAVLERQQQTQSENSDQIREELVRINHKLDKLIEVVAYERGRNGRANP